MSPISEAYMYEQLLRSVEDRFRVSEEHAQDLLRAAYSHLCPEPNKEVFIVTVSCVHAICSLLWIFKNVALEPRTLLFSVSCINYFLCSSFLHSLVRSSAR